jgi:hypothetical protein
VSGVSRNRGGFVKCVAIQKRLGIPALDEGSCNRKNFKLRLKRHHGDCIKPRVFEKNLPMVIFRSRGEKVTWWM